MGSRAGSPPGSGTESSHLHGPAITAGQDAISGPRAQVTQPVVAPWDVEVMAVAWLALHTHV